jgi:soluble lytic murein transglycosylase-like protein
MLKQYLITIASQKAEEYGLESSLVCAVIEQESNWNPWAMRFEPAFYAKYIVPSLEVGHFGPTEANARATSWGLMQVMGLVAREYGFGGPYLSELCDPQIGIDIGCKYMSVLYGKTGNNTKDALLRWNGGGNIAYPDQVMARMPQYA